MCDFISWIEYDKKCYYLTANDLNTPEGRELKKHLGNSYTDDIKGHGAIDFFYGLKGKGVHKECTDFSNPNNFPDEIVKAIKRGAFTGIGIPEMSQVLLVPASVEYERVRDAAYYVEYERVRAHASVEYKRVTDAAYVEYKRVTDAASVEYERVRAHASVEYERVIDAAYVEYKRVTDEYFWKIFKVKKNRKEAWR